MMNTTVFLPSENPFEGANHILKIVYVFNQFFISNWEPPLNQVEDLFGLTFVEDVKEFVEERKASSLAVV